MNQDETRVERYLADRRGEFTATKLSGVLNIRKSKLVNVLLSLYRLHYIRLHFVNDKIFVMHAGWRRK